MTVQLPPAAIVPPENEMELAPATGENVGEPQPSVEAFGVLATTIAPGDVGNVSENATPCRLSFGFGLLMRKVSVLVPPVKIGFGANTFVMLGG